MQGMFLKYIFLKVNRGYLFLLASMLVFNSLPAQKRNNIWAFGDSLGLNFNTNPVSVFKSKSLGINPPYYVSSICAPNGDLLFYTDGHTVWNRNNFIMPVYKKLWLWSENVIPLITPYVQNDSLYYIFGVEGSGRFNPPPNANKLVYFTTKMYNPGDVEEVVYPRPANRAFGTILLDNTSKVLAGTDHCNGVDRWITTHAPGAMYSFLITKSGVNPTPIVSPIPVSVLAAEKLNVKYSNIKFSANGERLIFPDNNSNKIIVLDFDNLTGKFSNAMALSIPDKQTLEDVEISADASKLYFGSYITEEDDIGAEVHFLYQMDLNAGSAASIEQTLYRINKNGDRVVCFRSCYIIRRTMQLGPDGKIYVSKREGYPVPFDQTLGVIEEPSKTGPAIGYQGSKIDLHRMPRFLNYNYVRSGSFTPRENSIQFKKNSCLDKPVDFSLIFNRVDSVKWNFGDPESGNRNISQLKKPQHQYPGPGTYTVKAIVYDRCFVDTAMASVIISEDEQVKASPSIKDTLLCQGEVLQLNATAPQTTQYFWDNMSANPVRKIDGPGEYSLTVYNACSFEVKTFKVAFKICPCNSYIPTAFTPNDDGLNDVFKPVFDDCVPKEYQFQIYDRYGGIIFKSDKSTEGWDGRKSHTQLTPGIYVWILNYRNPGTKKFISKKGTVTLLR
ncbi:MAG: gliding motility-associated C-terminal domain-containing protein [Ginsengibacter sp.]